MDENRILREHVFPSDVPLTAAFLLSVGGIVNETNPDCILLELPIAVPPAMFGLQALPKNLRFGLQFHRLSYVSDQDLVAGVHGASVWTPAVQASGLPQGDCICPLISVMLTTPHQLETLMIGLGVTISKKKEASVTPSTNKQNPANG